MAIIGVVADDFTGTASAGVLVAKSQARTGLFFDAKAVENFHDADRLDAVYVSSNSRHLKPEAAYQKVASTTSALKKLGVQYFSKKIDTTLRGGIGSEIDAMLDSLGEDAVAVMVSAMPQSKRICVGGYSVIDGVVLTETSIAQDVRNPVTESYIPDLIRRQTKQCVDFIPLNEVLKGADSLKEILKKSKKNGSRVMILDSITMEHIDIIAESCVDLKWNILAVDPGPFTMKLAYHRDIIGEQVSAAPEKTEKPHDKTVLIVAGSANPSTKAQMDYLCRQNHQCIKVSVAPGELISGGEKADSEIDRAASEIVDLFSSPEPPQVILVETALHGVIVDLNQEDQRHKYEQGASSAFINDGLARITEHVLAAVGQKRIAGLMLTGGDTMESVCRKIGVECIQALDNIVSQVDIGRIIGKYDGLPIVVKGGFCGYDEVGTDIVERLFWESSRA